MFARSNRIAVLVLLVFSCSSAALQAESLKTETSLQFVPNSVAFYGSMLNMGVQWNQFKATKAYEKIKQLPYVQAMVAEIKSNWESPDEESARKFKAFIEENPDLVSLMCDIMSHEIFVFGDAAVGDLINELNKINSGSQRMQIELLGLDDDDKEDAEKELKREMFNSLMKTVAEVAVPKMVLGFRVSDEAAAGDAINRITSAMESVEDGDEIKEMMKKESYDGTEFLQMTLKGSMIPWEELDDDGELDEEQLKVLEQAFNDRELTISLGVYKGCLMLVMGPDNNPLDAVAAGGSLLIDRDEFDRMRKMDDGRTFTQIGYASQEFVEQVSRPREQIAQAAETLKALLQLAPMDDEMKEELGDDVVNLAADLGRAIPKLGKVAGFQYMTENGYAGYTQDWAENLYFDGSKKLDILNHLGGKPLIAVASRHKSWTQPYDAMVKWCQRAGYYVNRLILEREEAEEFRELYASLRDQLTPMAERCVSITRDQVLPTMEEDGQVAWMIDADLEAQQQWHMMMPPAEKALPMFEFGRLYGIGDAGKIEAADLEMQQLADDFLETIKQFAKEHEEDMIEFLDGKAAQLPDRLQEFEWPDPETREVDAGKLRYFNFMQQLGLNEQIAPTDGLSKEVIVSGWSPATVERLLAETPIEGPLAEFADREMAYAVSIDMRGLMATIRPWVVYGMTLAAEQSEDDKIAEILPQVEATFDILECYRSATFVTFEEEDSLVTYTEAVLTDLE